MLLLAAGLGMVTVLGVFLARPIILGMNGKMFVKLKLGVVVFARSNNGMCYWSKRATNKMESATIKEKRVKFVLCMIMLFLNLLLDTKESLLQGSFEDCCSKLVHKLM